MIVDVDEGAGAACGVCRAVDRVTPHPWETSRKQEASQERVSSMCVCACVSVCAYNHAYIL